MGISLEDYAPRWLELEEQYKQEQRTQQVKRQFKQQQLRELLVDPKWEAYAQEIDARLTVASAACEGLTKKMLEGGLDDFKKLMPDYRYNLGIKTALEAALAIIKETQRT